MHPYLSMELGNARRQDDLRRAASFRRSKLAREARAEERQAGKPIVAHARRVSTAPGRGATVRPLRAGRAQAAGRESVAQAATRRSA